MAITIKTLLDAVTATGAGSAFAPRGAKRTFQAYGATTNGAGTATILIQGSLDGENWLTIATITLTLSTVDANDGFASDAPWAYVRGNVSVLTGTGAAVTLLLGDNKE